MRNDQPVARIDGGLVNFRVKLSHRRGAKNIWGSGKVLEELTDTGLFIFVRVDDHGENIELSTKATPNDSLKPIASLGAGECYIISLDNAVQITATCTNDTFVDCVVIAKAR